MAIADLEAARAAKLRPAGTVLVTDAGRGSAIAIIRSLARKGWLIVAADADANCIGFRSRYVSERLIYPHPARSPREFLSILYGAIEEYGVDLLIPVTDEVIHPLVSARERFEARCRVALPATDALAVVTNKDRTLALARKLGVPIPLTSVVHTEDEAVHAAQEMTWPVVLKPQVSRNYVPEEGVIEAMSVNYASDIDQLRIKMKPFEGRCAVLLQEYCQGCGQGVELLAYKGRVLAAFQHKRLAEIPITGGASAWRQSVALDPELFNYSQQLCESLIWTGLMMVEFKVGDRPRLMEINGRVWGSLPLAVFSGMDFPGRLADLYWQESPPNTEPATDYAVGVRAFNLNLIASWIPKVGLGKRSSEPHLSVPPRWHALAALWGIFSVRQRLDILTWDDPRPGLAEIVKIARKLARWRRRGKC